MQKQKRKRNHWVPKSYLRAFASDPERREKIWRFSKDDTGGDPEQKPIDKVAVRFNLYVRKNADGSRDYSFEEKLSDLEKCFGEEPWQQLCHDMVDLTNEPVRGMVALLAAVMHLRNPSEFERAQAVHAQLIPWLSEADGVPVVIEMKGKMFEIPAAEVAAFMNGDEDELKCHWISSVGSAVWLAELLVKMRYSVLTAEHPVFITTDSPITLVHPSLTHRGLRDRHTMVLFPVSSTRVLVFDHQKDQPDGHYYPAEQPASINLLLWRGAREYMFSSRNPDLVCREMLELEDQEREPDDGQGTVRK
jgi:hypothetical protein